MIKITPIANTYDILVAGAGLAGIRAATRCAQNGKKVLLVTPERLCSGSSFYPLMDTIHCLCTAGDQDRELFFQDIKDCSYGMNDDWMSRYYIDHIEECIEAMPEMGITPQKLSQKKLACFGHTPRDLYYWKDWDSLRAGAAKAVKATGLITLMERTQLIHLAVSEGTVNGALLLDSNGIRSVAANAVILASGGIGGLYVHNLNTVCTTGSTHALALKAGARLVNLEFNQFIPGFLSPMYKTVFREGSLKYCTSLTGPDGQDVLQKLLPDRDAYEECLRLREPHGPFTTADSSRYFDIAMMKSALAHIKDNGGRFDEATGCRIHYSPDIRKDTREYLQDYTDWLFREHHVQIEKDPITIAPFFHASNGGIWVNHRCSTEVDGLYACGEAAGGIHGADRLGGMASGSCLVFGTLAADSACAYVEKAAPGPWSEDSVKRQFMESCRPCSPFLKEQVQTGSFALNGITSPQQLCRKVQELMWQYGNIIRTQQGLNLALSRLDALSTLVNSTSGPDDSPLSLACCEDDTRFSAILKAVQYLDLGRALLISMVTRRESRGGHYREDYPEPDEINWNHRISISLDRSCYRAELI